MEVIVVLNSGGIYSFQVHEFKDAIYRHGLSEIEELVCTEAEKEEAYVEV
jgi:hypothetical protein